MVNNVFFSEGAYIVVHALCLRRELTFFHFCFYPISNLFLCNGNLLME